jgi:hypothetical protein
MSLNNDKNIKLETKRDVMLDKEDVAIETETTLDQKEVVQIGSKIYLFPRLHYETDKSYFLRREFFIKISPKTQKEYLNTLNMSIVWGNMKILECSYPPEVVENINKMLMVSS